MNKFSIISCSIFTKELKKYFETNDKIGSVHFLDSKLHCVPEELRNRIEEKIELERSKNNKIILIFGDCHSHMKDMENEPDIRKIEGYNCPMIILGKELYKKNAKAGAFFLIYEWAIRWEEIFRDFLKWDMKTAREILKGGHRFFLYLQNNNSEIPETELKEISEYFDLEYRIHKYDIHDLSKRIEKMMDEWLKDE